MLDRAVFEELTGGDPEVSRELTDLFREDAGELLDGLAKAIEAADDETVRRIGHTMKSSTGSMGATAASTLAKDIEREGMAKAVATFEELKTSVQVAIDDMEACCPVVGI